MIPKFRAWEKNMNEMIPVENIDFLAKQINTNSVWRMFHEIELMQSTGLKDKNGVEIYEGDIVEIKQQGSIDKYIPNNSVNEIVYKDSAFCVKDTWAISDIKWPIIAGLYYKASEEFEVLGNVYENPELLEVQE